MGKGSVFMVRVDPGDLDGVRMLTPEAVIAATAQVADVANEAWVLTRVRVLVVDDCA